MISLEPVEYPPRPVAGYPDVPLLYKEYVDLLIQLSPDKQIDREWYLFYSSVWERLWDFKRGFFSESSLLYMLSQLLTGCRSAALSGLRTICTPGLLTFKVPAVKGGLPSVFVYKNPPTPLTNLLSSRRSITDPPSYSGYRRELLTGNPNFFFSFPTDHLGATHVFRYFFVQVCHYICLVSLAELQPLLGWKNEDSVGSYVDPKIWLSSYEVPSES